MFHTTLDIAGVTLALRVRGPFDVPRFRHRFAPYEAAPRPLTPPSISSSSPRARS